MSNEIDVSKGTGQRPPAGRMQDEAGVRHIVGRGLRVTDAHAMHTPGANDRSELCGAMAWGDHSDDW